MATATSFASPQMNWDAPDAITAFARFKQKCRLMFSSVLKDADDEEKVSYILSDQAETPRSYIIKTGTGAQLRRNRIHLRPNNASNNLANNLSSCIPQGSMTRCASSSKNKPIRQYTTVPFYSYLRHWFFYANIFQTVPSKLA